MQNGAFYIRVSTKEQLEFSPDAQKRLLYEYAAANHILIDDSHIYMDCGISGRDSKSRPGFLKMIADAKLRPRPFDIILVHKLDRFSRNREDHIIYKSMLKNQYKIAVVSITEQINEDKSSVIMEAMLEAMAEYYSINLGHEVKKGMFEAALQGQIQCRPPLGYSISPDDKSPAINLSEATIVQLIFSKYLLDHFSCYEIAKYLNDHHITTKQGKPFRACTVSYILNNPFYKGETRWNVYSKKLKRKTPPNQWVITKGNHTPIISSLNWEAAFLKSSALTMKKKARPPSLLKHWLSSLLICSACGRSLSYCSSHKSSTTHKTYYNFQCSGYLKKKCTISHKISAKKMETCVLDILKQDFGNSFFAVSSQNKTSINNQINDVTLLLDLLFNQEKLYEQAYAAGIDTKAEYEANTTLLKLRIENLTAEITSLQKELLLVNDINQPLTLTIPMILESLDLSIGDKNKMLRTIVQKIVYIKEINAIDIYYQTP